MLNQPTQPEHDRPAKEDLRERARDEAEQFRRLAEQAREVRDQHREALEMVRKGNAYGKPERRPEPRERTLGSQLNLPVMQR